MSYKSPVKDEIPGITSFLYEANRPRESYEDRNHWKILEEAKIQAENAGIKDISLEGLIDQVSRITIELQEGNKSHRDLEEQYEKLDIEHTQLENIHKDLQHELEIQQPQIVHLEEQLTLWMDVTMDFGEHLDDCGWIEIINSARVVNAQEKEYCTCGWYKKRMDLKRDPRFKNSRPPEVKVIIKKKSQIRDLDI